VWKPSVNIIIEGYDKRYVWQRSDFMSGGKPIQVL